MVRGTGAAHLRLAARTAGDLWLDRLSMMTTLPGESLGTGTRVT